MLLFSIPESEWQFEVEERKTSFYVWKTVRITDYLILLHFFLSQEL